MQHHLTALMEQNPQHGASQENRDVAGFDACRRFKYDLTAAAEQKTRHGRNTEEEAITGDLPGRAARAGLGQCLRHRAGAHEDVGNCFRRVGCCDRTG